MKELDITRRAQEYLAALTSRGYDVMVPDSYSDIPSLVLQTGRTRQNPMHSISRNDFTKEDAFWLFLKQSDRVIGGCAAVYYDLRQDDFGDFLKRTSEQQYERHAPIKSISDTVVARLKGRLIYTGELQLHTDFKGNISVLQCYFRMLLALSALKWEFDHIYAFVAQEHRRLIDVYGFNWWLDQPIQWRGDPPPGRLNSHLVCGISRNDFLHQWSLKSRFALNEPK